MKVPQSQSPSAPPRLWDIAAHWDVAARRSGAAGLRGCGRHGRVTSGLWDCGTAGPWGCGAVGLWDHGVTMHGNGVGTARGRVGGVWPCGRGAPTRTHPGASTALWDCGASWLWGVAALGLRRRRVLGSVAAAPCKRGPRARGSGAGLGWLKRRTPRAGHRRRGAQRPRPVSPCDWPQGYCFSKTFRSSSFRTRSSAPRTSSGRQSLSSPRS